MKSATMRLLVTVCVCAWVASEGLARDWHVSIARGRGKTGSVEKPAKDLGNIISRLEDGDRVFIAEGVYLGRGENGHDGIDKPVEIYGGFADDFSKRDPWGAHKTILAGTNNTENWVQGYRLSIDLSKRRDIRGQHKVVVDGLIVDNGPRNRYADETESKIIRMANPKTGQNPTPGFGGISVAVTKQGDIEIRNCVVLNTASTGGGATKALSPGGAVSYSSPLWVCTITMSASGSVRAIDCSSCGGYSGPNPGLSYPASRNG